MKTWEEKYTDLFEPFLENTFKIEKITRPHKYDNVAELAVIIRDWFIDQRNNRGMIGSGISNIALCVHLGITTMTFNNMKAYSEGFKNLIDITKACIEEYWVEQLGTSESAAKFILSTMPDYTEVTKTIVESDNFIINVVNPKKNS